MERSGPIELWLQVAAVDGGWHWRQKRLGVAGVRLPGWLAPKTIASKSVMDGKYAFSVDIRVPILGSILAYRGELLLLA